MLKKELIKKIAIETNLTQKLVWQVIDAYHDVVIDTVSNGENIKIVGFGSFGRRKVTAKQIKLNGKIVNATEKWKPKFTASKDFVTSTIEGGNK